MDKEKIKTLKKFERALVDLARVMDMADVEFRGISSTSMSVDDMLAKCEVKILLENASLYVKTIVLVGCISQYFRLLCRRDVNCCIGEMHLSVH